MKTNLSVALALPKELFITAMENDGHEVRIFCSTKKKVRYCIHCSSITRMYGTVMNRKRHTYFGGKKVFLHILKRKLQCKYCKRIFTEQIPGFKGQRTTDYFTQIVQEKSRNQDYSSVARELGISPMTVMRKQDLLPLDVFTVPIYDEIHLGIDGTYLNGDDEIIVMGDVQKKEFFGVTKTNKAAEAKKLLRTHLINNGKIIKTVSLDMSKQMKSIADSVCPAAAIVVDKFHVFTLVHRTIDLCRIAVEKSNAERFGIKRLLLMKVETVESIKTKPKWEQKVRYFRELLGMNADIRILWDLKNVLHRLYEAKDRNQAEIYWNNLMVHIDTYRSIHPEFNDLKETLETWKEYILNYFIYWVTNAYIEGVNNRIETLKRKRCGYRSLERFLKCIVFSLLPITSFVQMPLFIN